MEAKTNSQRKPYYLLSKSGKRKRKRMTFEDETQCEEAYENHRPSTSTNLRQVTKESFRLKDDLGCTVNTSTENISEAEIDFDKSPYSIRNSDSEDDVNTSSSEGGELLATEVECHVSPKAGVKNFVRDWALSENIPLSSLTSLCKGLKSNHPECFFKLPVDARTIMKTPRDTLTFKSVPPGEYFHVGLKSQLELFLSLVSDIPNCIQTLFNVDGIPLFKSSKGELWPILMEMPTSELKHKVFPVGIYYGDGKPKNLEIYLEEFLQELVDLLQNGYVFKNKVVKVELLGFCCDAPAKAYLLGTITHTGFFSCTRCTIEGETYERRRIFSATDCTLRSDSDFRERRDTHYQPPDRFTPLLNVPNLNFAKSFVLDYMHLVCLGVVRTLLSAWICGPKDFLLPVSVRSSMSESLTSISCHVPLEISRKPRDLKFLRGWKATEFRSFLLYFAPVVLKNSLDSKKYLHFLSLHIALTILLSPKLCKESSLRSYSRSLLVNFVELTPKLYSPRFLTHNFHNLIHVVDDADHFSKLIEQFSLNDISSFPFENFLQQLKKLTRGYAKPLQQISRRITELYISGHIKNFYVPQQQKTKVQFKEPYNGPAIPLTGQNPQYKCVQFPNFKHTISSPNNCCSLTSGEIVLIENIAFSTDHKTEVIIGRTYKHVSDFYSKPLCESSVLNIFKVKDLVEVKQIWKVTNIRFTNVHLPFEDHFVVIPLIHTCT